MRIRSGRRPAYWRAALCLSALLALALVLQAGQQAQQPRPGRAPLPPAAAPATEQVPSPVIRVSSNLVAVPVSVTDGSGNPVVNLSAKDFRIEEEGRARPVVHLGEPGKTPMDLVLLFDVSGSIRERFAFEQRAASDFLKIVFKPSDGVSVFAVGDVPRLIQPRTSSVDQAIAGMMRLSPTKEATAFFDAVVAAAQHLRKSAEPGTRRVVLAISDGEDTHSEKNKLADAMREIQRSDSVFYSVNPSGPAIRLNIISMKGQEALTSLAAETGGAFLPVSEGELEAVFKRIAAELQAQYLLGFYSSEDRADGSFRRIAVTLPSRSELRIRARRGYYAPSSAGVSPAPASAR